MENRVCLVVDLDYIYLTGIECSGINLDMLAGYLSSMLSTNDAKPGKVDVVFITSVDGEEAWKYLSKDIKEKVEAASMVYVAKRNYLQPDVPFKLPGLPAERIDQQVRVSTHNIHCRANVKFMLTALASYLEVVIRKINDVVFPKI